MQKILIRQIDELILESIEELSSLSKEEVDTDIINKIIRKQLMISKALNGKAMLLGTKCTTNLEEKINAYSGI